MRGAAASEENLCRTGLRLGNAIAFVPMNVPIGGTTKVAVPKTYSLKDLGTVILPKRRGWDSNPWSPCGDSGFQDRFTSDATILCDNRLRENGQADGALFGTRGCQCMSINDADLQQLVEIWPGIPPQFRKQILELARGLADRS
jgi:hypothetical protein